MLSSLQTTVSNGSEECPVFVEQGCGWQGNIQKSVAACIEHESGHMFL
jgi:hypothetical protein